jgi:predicted dehydrogenase
MTQPVRIGLIGFGRVARTYLRWHERLRWQGVVEHVIACDLLEKHRDDALNTYGFAHFTTNYEDVISRSDVDLALIYTSMQTHGPIALAALAAGKHVQVEKPFAPNLDMGRQLVEAARTSAGYLVPAPYSILSPTYRTIWRRVQGGDIGRPYMARSLYGHSGPTWGPWFYQKGGGAMFDLGVYNITSLTGLLGPAKRVMAMSGSAVHERIIDGQTIPVEADDNSHTLLDFGDAIFAVATTGFTIQKYRTAGIEVYGSKGTIQLMGDDFRPRGYELWLNDVGAWQVFAETHPEWTWTDGLRHTVECIQTGAHPLVTPEHAYHVLEIMIKAQESGADGQQKNIESVFPPLRLAEGA